MILVTVITGGYDIDTEEQEFMFESVEACKASNGWRQWLEMSKESGICITVESHPMTESEVVTYKAYLAAKAVADQLHYQAMVSITCNYEKVPETLLTTAEV